MRSFRGVLAVTVLLALVAPTGVTAADGTPLPAGTPDEVLVRYRAETTPAERRSVAADLGLRAIRTGADSRTQVLVADGLSPATTRRRLLDDPRVAAVAPNHRRELTDEITAEPGFPALWGLHNTGQRLDGERVQTGVADVDIDGLEALRITKGDSDVVVAVIDDGIDFSHPDLADRAWTNPGEAGPLATNGVDDDDNGHVDDVHGWDFCNDDATVHDAGADSHGTHVAGTIAASLDGTGVVGVAPGISLMALKFIDDSGCGTDEMAVAAIDYAASFGVPIINASWGGSGASPVLDLAIAESNALFVAAAGNGVEPSPGVGRNLDSPTYEFFPAESTVANVLSVAAIDQRGELAPFSNYGASTIDVSAPGTNIASAVPRIPGVCNVCWAWMAGTSMAAPHVSGIAALVASVAPTPLSPIGLRTRILTRGATLAPTAGKTVTGRLANAWRSIDVTGPVALPVNRHGINVGSIVGSSVSTTLVWPAATDDLSGVASYALRRRLGSGPWSTVASGLTARSAKQSLTFGTPTRFGVSARDRVGNLGAPADAPAVTAVLLQDGTSLARYGGTWSTVTSTTASNRKLHVTTQAGASVEFRTTARAIGIVARKRPGNGRAKVYVDGAYVQTIDLNRATTQSRVVVFNRSWPTNGVHTIKLVAVGTAGRPRVEIDAFAILR